MAYPPARSVRAELAIGIHEGGYCVPGKDWGGPQDDRTRLPDTDNDHEYLLTLPGVNDRA
jgi:hypothetical protein